LELQIKKAKANGVRTKQVGFEKPCDKMTEAIVMDGGKRGQIVKVCADLSCRVHHPDTPSPQQIERHNNSSRFQMHHPRPFLNGVPRTIEMTVRSPKEKLSFLAY